MIPVNINEFMNRFHRVERELSLFDSTVDGERWWDSVRFDACYFLFDCLTGLTYSSAHQPPPRRRRLGVMRRALHRYLLLARGSIGQKDLLSVRAARNVVDGRLQDVVLDPVIHIVANDTLTIDTLPRRYHLPEYNPSRWPGTVPRSLSGILHTLVEEFGIDKCHAGALDALIRQERGQYACQAAGYQCLLTALRPKAVLLVQNGIEKALFHVAKIYGIPTVEMQHGLIGHGHPAYSYSREIDYGHQTSLPDLFLTFSEFWQNSGHYPAGRYEVVGTDHFAAGFAPLERPLGTIMVIAANIYHVEMLALTRDIAARMPDRHFIYKLHPNQRQDAPAIQAVLANQPNVMVGDPMTPASRMMDNVSHLVAVQSTVVYEALQHGRRVCILPWYDYQIHADIFDLPSVSVSDQGEALAASLAIPVENAARPVFFERFDAERARTIMASVIDAQRNGNDRP